MKTKLSLLVFCERNRYNKNELQKKEWMLNDTNSLYELLGK